MSDPSSSDDSNRISRRSYLGLTGLAFGAALSTVPGGSDGAGASGPVARYGYGGAGLTAADCDSKRNASRRCRDESTTTSRSSSDDSWRWFSLFDLPPGRSSETTTTREPTTTAEPTTTEPTSTTKPTTTTTSTTTTSEPATTTTEEPTTTTTTREPTTTEPTTTTSTSTTTTTTTVDDNYGVQGYGQYGYGGVST